MDASPLQSVWRLLRETGRRWGENDGSLLAASMAYYAAFSLFPLLMVLLSGLGFALQFSTQAQTSEQELLTLINQNVAPALAVQMEQILGEVRNNAVFSGPIGLVALLLGAMASFVHLDYAFDRLWRIEHKPMGIRGTVRRLLGARLNAFLILCGLGLLIIGAFVFGLSLAAMHRWASQWRAASFAWRAFELSSGLAFHTVVFTLLYKALPKAKVHWRHALAGGLFVAVVWEIGRLTMAYIIVGKNYTPFGVVGSFIAIMVWVYYASSLVFLGAQFVEVLEKPKDLPLVPS